jgi:CubicO group peptidase (beta-lactamase class C family)
MLMSTRACRIVALILGTSAAHCVEAQKALQRSDMAAETPAAPMRNRVASSAPASSGEGPSLIRRLDNSTITSAEAERTVTQLMKAAEVTGAGIAILNDGKIVYLKAYGLRDTQKNLPLTVDSIMSVASLSKAAFAYMTTAPHILGGFSLAHV